MRNKGTARELEERRQKGVELLKEGLSAKEVAQRFGVRSYTVCHWRRLYERHGSSGLKIEWSSGRPNKLNKRELKRLEQVLLKGATKFGYDSELWSAPRIVDVIEKLFGVRYHPHHVAKILKALGWSAQKPKRRALERDEKQIQAWVKNDWPRIKKKPKKHEQK